MRRRIPAIIAAALLVVAGVSAAPLSAAADTVPFPPLSPFHNVVGSIDTIEFVAGKGLVATGWVIDTSDPRAVQGLEYQVGYPDGRTGWGGGLGGNGLPRPDVAAVYPDAGPNHGFRTELGYYEAIGTYKFCAEASFEAFACKTVSFEGERISGTFESLSLDLAPTPAQIRMQGWTSDTWLGHGSPTGGAFVPLNYSIDFVPLSGPGSTTDSGAWHHDLSSGASSDRPDVRAAHPSTPGVMGFDDHVDIDDAGRYTVCVTPQPYFADYRNASVSPLGCRSIDVRTVEGTARVLTGTAEPGGTITASATTWTPAQATDAISWVRSGNGTAGVELPELRGSTSYPVSTADVGHWVSLYETASAPGLLPLRTWAGIGPVTLPGVETSRIAGDDRYAVSVATSLARFPDATAGAPVVYVASGQSFPDALAAGPAAAEQGGSLLLTTGADLPPVVAAEITRLHPASIVVVGGEASVSASVQKALARLAPTTRIGGADRYETSRLLLASAFPDGADRVFVVTGRGYADALPAGAAAASLGAPVLLVDGGASSADTATRAALASGGTSTATVVGGVNAVSAGVAATLGAKISVERISGADRFASAVALNRSVHSSADTVYIATGMNFPDGLTGGALAGSLGAPLYLSQSGCLSSEVIDDILSLHATSAVLLGGPAAISYPVEGLYAC
ncbi:cell wall-binding repeat-containing protein [Herbiconiux flava]|uniref:Putative cell wall-binding protein n=1 Tax=Herbiconiux flava TaxID=881268 RepID=A0A852ST30_9MICO|nr:cell wall-binding repeat-containing protein [Herbiconiux flava]NYD72106.1 putative cell wall-binding protein [Herbiconiux flava]GLK17930.1 hypothetical protein GCM10017602_24120 [Herbiconiux flava]